ncbi:T25K16.8 [Arabidopsis thaliana]|nr:T25K16.8 [Arabidopsis thaliana]
MATAFAPTKLTATVPLHGSHENRLLLPIRLAPPSSFLGSTRSLSLRRLNHSNATRRSPVVSVQEVVKEKQSTNNTSLLITKEEGLELYEDMILGRSFEDMCAQMYYRGKMFGFVHLYNGQEAVSTGFIKLLTKSDSVVSTYRDHVHALSKGVSARAVMSELFGKVTGCCRGQGGSMHMFSKEHNMLGGFAFIGEGIPVATGAAFSSKYRREVLKQDCDDVTVAFFGDGTCNNGQFFECLNMAALYKLPIIFVVENNLWAIGMSHLRATSDPEIWKKGPAFGMPGVHVDGMDVLKVREVAKEAVTRARRGEGPTLVECETYRFRGHSLADPDELRDAAEKAKYAARDPIAALKKYLIENKLAKEAELKSIEKKIDELVEEAVEFADASPQPGRSQLLENVFADPKGFGIGPDGRYRSQPLQIKVSSSELSVLDEEKEEEVVKGEAEPNKDSVVSKAEPVKKPRPCELYVCNIPRSYDIAQLLDMFQPFGTVISVEVVSRNPQTGESRGSGYVTMGSINSAKIAIASLDGTVRARETKKQEVGGREMRVRYSVDMNPGTRRNPEVLNSTPKKILMYESQHKVYVGNLPWFTQPDGLRNHFSKFGTIVSTRVLHDRKTGRNRVFAFLSFTSGEERDAALSFNGTVNNMKVAESSSEKVSRRVSRKPTVLLLLQRHLLDTNNV